MRRSGTVIIAVFYDELRGADVFIEVLRRTYRKVYLEWEGWHILSLALSSGLFLSLSAGAPGCHVAQAGLERFQLSRLRFRTKGRELSFVRQLRLSFR